MLKPGKEHSSCTTLESRQLKFKANQRGVHEIYLFLKSIWQNCYRFLQSLEYCVNNKNRHLF